MRAIVALGLLALLAAPLPLGSADGEVTCEVRTSPTAIPVGTFYVQGAGSYWEESNGLAGLQMRSSGCSDGHQIPGDRCLFFVEGATPSAGCTLNAVNGKASGP